MTRNDWGGLFVFPVLSDSLEENPGNETEAEQCTNGDLAGKTMKGNRQRYSVYLVLLCVLGMVGCHTVSIPEPTKNLVPPGMPLETVRRLIVLSIDESSAKSEWENPTTPSQKVLKEVFAVLKSRSHWRIEAIEPQAIRAAIRHRSHYVAAKVQFTESEWWVVIVDGRRIKFDGESIHEKGLLWVDDLEQQIRRAFGTYQTMIELERRA